MNELRNDFYARQKAAERTFFVWAMVLITFFVCVLAVGSQERTLGEYAPPSELCSYAGGY